MEGRSTKKSKRWRFRLWNDVTENFEYETDLDQRTKAVYQRIDRSPFGYLVVVVAAVGFFTDSYEIFAINVVLPIINVVYFQDQMDRGLGIALSCATLIGTAVGQMAFGYWADRYGRRKMYGFELVLLIASTMGLTMASTGEHGSMNIAVWLFWWRLMMGVSIGGDYPLSAVIGSEFAPTKHRGRMLACIFFMQPVGQLLGNVVALGILYHYRHPILGTTDLNGKCTAECISALDACWRWIVGIGIIPAFVALYFRLTIPESPRYTSDIQNNLKKAHLETLEYYGDWESDREEEVYAHADFMDSLAVGRAASFMTETNSAPFITEHIVGGQPHPNHPYSHGFAIPPRRQSYGSDSIVSDDNQMTNIHLQMAQSPTMTASSPDTLQPRQPSLPSVSITPTPSNNPTRLVTSQNKIDEENPHRSSISSHNTTHQSTSTPSQKLTIKSYFFEQKNYKTLLGTALSWFLLDWAFYGLSINNFAIISKLYRSDSTPNTDIYIKLRDNILGSLVINSTGAMVGSMIMIKIVKFFSRRKIQFWGFVVLAVLLFTTGWTYKYLLGREMELGRKGMSGSKAAVVVLYVLCQVAFNLGPNTTTFIIAAEVFPTKYRASCHGLSAAAGKLGSVIAHAFTETVRFGNGPYVDEVGSNSLCYVLLIFSVLMGLGAAVTWYLVPEVQDEKGNNKTLEELAKGLCIDGNTVEES